MRLHLIYVITTCIGISAALNVQANYNDYNNYDYEFLNEEAERHDAQRNAEENAADEFIKASEDLSDYQIEDNRSKSKEAQGESNVVPEIGDILKVDETKDILEEYDIKHENLKQFKRDTDSKTPVDADYAFDDTDKGISDALKDLADDTEINNKIDEIVKDAIRRKEISADALNNNDDGLRNHIIAHVLRKENERNQYFDVNYGENAELTKLKHKRDTEGKTLTDADYEFDDTDKSISDALKDLGNDTEINNKIDDIVDKASRNQNNDDGLRNHIIADNIKKERERHQYFDVTHDVNPSNNAPLTKLQHKRDTEGKTLTDADYEFDDTDKSISDALKDLANDTEINNKIDDIVDNASRNENNDGVLQNQHILAHQFKKIMERNENLDLHYGELVNPTNNDIAQLNKLEHKRDTEDKILEDSDYSFDDENEKSISDALKDLADDTEINEKIDEIVNDASQDDQISAETLKKIREQIEDLDIVDGERIIPSYNKVGELTNLLPETFDETKDILENDNENNFDANLNNSDENLKQDTEGKILEDADYSFDDDNEKSISDALKDLADDTEINHKIDEILNDVLRNQDISAETLKKIREQNDDPDVIDDIDDLTDLQLDTSDDQEKPIDDNNKELSSDEDTELAENKIEDADNDDKSKLEMIPQEAAKSSNEISNEDKFANYEMDNFDDMDDYDDDTVDKAYADLNADLDKLLKTMDKLTNGLSDDTEERDTVETLDEIENMDIKDYEEKYQRPYGESRVLSARDEYEDLGNSNLSDIFKEANEEEDDVSKEKEEPNSEEDAEEVKPAPIPYLNDAMVAEPSEKDSSTSTTPSGTTIKTKMVDELTSEEFSDLMSQFKLLHSEDLDVNADTFAEHVAPINMKLRVDEPLILTSPNYPNAYPTNNIVDWILEGEGMGIELNITDFQLNGAVGDYVLIKPGGLDESGHEGLVISYRLTSERRYRFLDVDRMFIRFESKIGMPFLRGFEFSLKMISPPAEDSAPAPLPEPVLAPPRDTLTLTLGGLTHDQFLEARESFRQIIAAMAEKYIASHAIYPGTNTTMEVTQITAVSLCNVHWPNFENCVEVTFGVPLAYEDEMEPRLTKDDLIDMWQTYVIEDSFESQLNDLGIMEFAVPDGRAAARAWLLLAGGAALCAALLALALWRLSCFEDYTRMKAYSDTDSIVEKRGLDLYPTPHQTLPPLYEQAWPELDDTARVDMGGFANNSFARDELHDFDSDEDVITPRDRNGVVSARDVYSSNV